MSFIEIHTVGVRSCIVGDLPKEIHQELTSVLSWVDPLELKASYKFYKNGKFPTGSLTTVLRILRRRGYDIKVVNVENTLCSQFETSVAVEKFAPYQEEAIEACISNKFGVFSAVPRFGKTIVAASIIGRLGKEAVFLVDSLSLLHQAKEEIQRVLPGVRVGAVGDSVWDVQPVTVASVASLYSRIKQNDKAVMDWLKRVHTVVYDEVHHAGAARSVAVLSEFSGCKSLIGLSGTPVRDDARAPIVFMVFGPIVYTPPYDKLVDYGSVCPITVQVKRMPQVFVEVEGNLSFRDFKILSRKEKSQLVKDTRKVIEKAINFNKERNQYIAQYVRDNVKKNYSCAILVKEIKHADEIKKFLPEAVIITAKTKNREDLFKKLRNKEIMVVVSTVMKEAVSIPSLSCVVLAGGGRSQVAAIQGAFRGATKFSGETARGFFDKDRAYVLCFRDTTGFLNSQSRALINHLKQLVDKSPQNSMEEIE